MSIWEDRLGQLVAALGDAYPQRVVTRSFRNFDYRAPQDLARGVFTILSRSGQFDLSRQRLDGSYSHQLLLVGQFVGKEDDEPQQTEAREFAMLEEIFDFVATASGELRGLDVVGWRNSMQLEHPWGWVQLDLILED